MQLTGRFSTSLNEEVFSGDFDSRLEAIDDMRRDLVTEKGTKFYVGEQISYEAKDFLDVDILLETMGEMAYEKVSEASEGWPFIGDEQAKEELSELINGWFTKHKQQPEFYGLDDVKEYLV